MRAITIAENNDDMESLFQKNLMISKGRKRISTRGGTDREEATVEQQHEEMNLMQTLTGTRATTFFGSRMAMLQFHLESMEVQQANHIVRFFQAKLQKWRSEWIMGLRSVSRDRVERLCAVLAAYETENDESIAQGADATWAQNQWAYLEEHLAIDAHRLQEEAACQVVENDTLPHTQAGSSTPQGVTLVRRTPEGPWEKASTGEEEELRAHDADEQQQREGQQRHDECIWETMQKQKEEERKARASQSWDDWAMTSEMEGATRSRPVKKFRLDVTVKDKEGNELATTVLEGDTETDDVPQVVLGMQTEIVETEAAPASPSSTSPHGRAQELGAEDEAGASEAETIAVAAQACPELSDLATLEDVLASTMRREWFDLWCCNQVDSEMVERKFGRKILETFEINRAMIEMDEASQVDRDFIQQNQANEGMGMAMTGPLAGVNKGSKMSNVVPAAEEAEGGGSSSASGGDSHAGMSDMNLKNQGSVAAEGQVRGELEDGEGVGWPGPAGDGKVRQWMFPKPVAEQREIADAPMDVDERGSGYVAADSVEQEVLQNTQLDGVADAGMAGTSSNGGAIIAEAAVGETELAEGESAGERRPSSTEGQGSSRQLDL